jgi:uncharacterized membrane protein YdfJ with MMPL/SSD domain
MEASCVLVRDIALLVVMLLAVPPLALLFFELLWWFVETVHDWEKLKESCFAVDEALRPASSIEAKGEQEQEIDEKSANQEGPLGARSTMWG